MTRVRSSSKGEQKCKVLCPEMAYEVFIFVPNEGWYVTLRARPCKSLQYLEVVLTQSSMIVLYMYNIHKYHHSFSERMFSTVSKKFGSIILMSTPNEKLNQF